MSNQLLAQLFRGQIGNPALEGSNVLHDIQVGTIIGNSVQAFFQLLLPNIVSLLWIIGIILFMMHLLVGAIHWIMSEGEKVGLQKAKDEIFSAVIGLFVMFSTFAIMKVFEIFLGINLIKIDFTPLFIK